jgi:N-acylneuraminate cytidylyltransferase
MEVFAVIPARGGSKRVPRKNIREVAGKPLIVHAIEQANESETIDRAIISTEDDEIKQVAREYGGEVPFTRPTELATDDASSIEVVEHALEWIFTEEAKPEIVVLLQATAPLRSVGDIDGAIRKLQQNEAESVISICEYADPPHWSVTEDSDGFLSSYFEPDMLWRDDIPRSQDLPTLKHPNGAVFAADVDAFREQNTFYTDQTIGYEMPVERSVDIDEPFELEIVRALMKD